MFVRVAMHDPNDDAEQGWGILDELYLDIAVGETVTDDVSFFFTVE
jgi:hypothetical protein